MHHAGWSSRFPQAYPGLLTCPLLIPVCRPSDMREHAAHYTALHQGTPDELGSSMSMEELANSDSFTPEQKGLIFMKILEHAKRKSQPAASAVSAEPPPAAIAQPMLAPLANAVNSAQMLKNRAEARAFEASHTATPVLGSAMETAVRGLSSSGSLPPNSSASPQGSAPPPPPARLVRFTVRYIVEKVPPHLAFTFSRVFDANAKEFLCVFNGFQGQPICSSEPGAWQKYVNAGNQACYFKAKINAYPNALAAYNDCLGWLLKQRVIHASQLSEYSCSQCFNTHAGTPDDPAYCPEPAVDWTPKLLWDHPPCLQKRGTRGSVQDGCHGRHPWGYECPHD